MHVVSTRPCCKDRAKKCAFGRIKITSNVCSVVSASITSAHTRTDTTARLPRARVDRGVGDSKNGRKGICQVLRRTISEMYIRERASVTYVTRHGLAATVVRPSSWDLHAAVKSVTLVQACQLDISMKGRIDR